MALNLLGYETSHPIVQRGLSGLDRFTITEDTPDGPVRRLEACQSPVWDTVLTMTALADAGLAPDDPSLTRAAQWVLGEEIRGPGDWQVRRPKTAVGGWAFEFDNDNYPDTDDTAEVVLALRRVAVPSQRRHRPRSRPGWPGCSPRTAAGARSTRTTPAMLVNKLPFCDFGAVIDPPSADVTAHIVEAFAAEGRAAEPAARRGVVWLLRAQEQRRIVVRPLGRELPLRHRRRGARADRGRGEAGQAGHPPRRGLARAAPEPGRRLGRGPALLRRPGAGRPGRVHRVADRLGAARPAGGGGAGQRRDRARHPLARRRRKPKTAPGTSRGSPAPASPATSTSTTTCTGWPSP